MSVSSVKNLNGSVFSAVQDAELTEVVQTNSGNWQDITAYQNASAGYLTAHQDISNLMPKSESANFYPMEGNPSGFLITHQAISADEWNSNYETVTTNSGVWGGSALPVSAGQGVKINLVNNTLVFSNDETVLWEGNLSSLNTEISLADSLKNFNSYKVFGYNTENKYGVVSEFTYNSAGPNWFSLTNTRIQSNNYLTIYGSYVSANTDWNKLKITYMSNKFCISGGLTHSTSFGVGITKIVGINRVAGGN